MRSYVCSKCSNLLELVKDSPVSRTGLYGESAQPGIWSYRKALPIEPDVRAVSLSEGHTPLVLVSRIGAKFGLKGLHVKNEGQNPSGSFKDRGMTVAVTRAVQGGSKLLICASTGNTAASMAAYAARAGVTAMVTVPAGKVASGKLAQVYAYGAKIIRVEGDFDAALAITLKVAAEIKELSVMNSVNPYRIEGQKTNAYEIYEQLRLQGPRLRRPPGGERGQHQRHLEGLQGAEGVGDLQLPPEDGRGAGRRSPAHRRGDPARPRLRHSRSSRRPSRPR